jgi:hypothetical protein
MNETTITVLIEYIGEQKKSVQPVIFTSHWPALAGAYPAASEPRFRTEAREHLCMPGEMTSLAAAVDRYAARLQADAAPDRLLSTPCLAVTCVRGGAATGGSRTRIEIERAAADAFLDAVLYALDERNQPARSSIELLRTQIL